MLMDVFSGFDAYYLAGWKCFVLWGTPIALVALLNTNVYAATNVYKLVLMELIKLIWRVCSGSVREVPEFILFLVSVFIVILGVNLMGQIPYCFSVSSHMTFSMAFSIPIWSVMVLPSVLLTFNKFLSRLVPEGTFFLVKVIVVISEIVSILARPVSLSLRLSINIALGHVVLALLGDWGSATLAVWGTNVVSLTFGVWLCCTFITMLETVVSFIQAYVFCLLIAMYMDECSDLYTGNGDKSESLADSDNETYVNSSEMGVFSWNYYVNTVTDSWVFRRVVDSSLYRWVSDSYLGNIINNMVISDLFGGSVLSNLYLFYSWVLRLERGLFSWLNALYNNIYESGLVYYNERSKNDSSYNLFKFAWEVVTMSVVFLLSQFFKYKLNILSVVLNEMWLIIVKVRSYLNSLVMKVWDANWDEIFTKSAWINAWDRIGKGKQ